MRQYPTPPERALWQALRNRQIASLKFRRQVPMGRYIVDFYCPPARLVVEMDGETHVDSAGDLMRDLWLGEQGLNTLRLWNNEVMGNLAGVLAVIMETAAQRSPNLSRNRRGK